MARTIKEALEKKLNGYYIGARLVLPFRCQILKIIVEGEIFTEMVGSKHIKIAQDPQNTSIYFRSTGKLDQLINSYRTIKIIVAEWDADLTEVENHIKLILKIDESHRVRIEPPSGDILFIE